MWGVKGSALWMGDVIGDSVTRHTACTETVSSRPCSAHGEAAFTGLAHIIIASSEGSSRAKALVWVMWLCSVYVCVIASACAIVIV
jgi:hypothetical protein